MTEKRIRFGELFFEKRKRRGFNIYEAKKINYELLGNQLPHIHWHVIPRLANDPAPLESVWRVEHQAMPLGSPDLQQQIQQIQKQLQF